MNPLSFPFLLPHDKNPNHSKALDGLRGLAVLIVIFSHLSNNKINLLPFLDFSTIGKYGVYLFFVLSSYLLDKQIINNLIQHKTNLKYWLNYSLRRFLRIIPLFIIALLLNYFLTKNNCAWAIQLTYNELIDHLLFKQGKDIFWSIPVEFKYYIVSPFLMYFMFKAIRWNITLVATSFIVLVAASIILTYALKLNELSLVKYLPLFLFGSLIAIIEETQPNIMNYIKTHLKILNTTAMISLLIIIISIPYYFNFIFNTNIKHFHHSVFFSVYALLWSLVLLAAKHGKHIITKLFEYKPLRIIGSLSFSLYLFHMPILSYFNLTNINVSVKFLLVILFSTFAATISYVLIERPLSRVRISK